MPDGGYAGTTGRCLRIDVPRGSIIDQLPDDDRRAWRQIRRWATVFPELQEPGVVWQVTQPKEASDG